ncbi:MAG: hypothetical protein AB8H79_11300 [Myxococcota bacterium]
MKASILGLVLLGACSTPTGVMALPIDDWNAWLYVPDDLPDGPVPALVHLHYAGEGEKLANDRELQAELQESKMIGVFPEGGGGPGDDWRVGVNKDEIQRDDRGFLAKVARAIRERDDVEGVYLSGFSKGGAMVYDMACLGDDVYDGFLPMGGAMQDWVFEDCPAAQRPLRHLQGRTDPKWPRTTADNPDSNHEGIVDSITALQDEPNCMQTQTWEGDCEVWAGCGFDTRLCWFDGGHFEPDGWIVAHRNWIDGVHGASR